MLSKLLVTAAKKHRDAMAGKLREFNLYVGQDIFLLALHNSGKLTQKELKEQLSVEYATIHKIASRLQKRGMVSKEKNPEDKRASIIQLTEKGAKVAEDIHRLWKVLEADFFAALNFNEKKELHRLLGKLNENAR